MNLSADMSIIEIDNLIKSLPKERLQKELESPTGHFPLYLVAGRLKEMESMEADAQAAAAEKKTSELAPSVAHRLAMTQPPVMSEVAAAPQPQPQPDPAGQAAQMLMPTVNAAGGYSLPTVYAETGKQGADTSELVNQYLAELKLRKDRAEEKRSKTDEFAVDNSGDFAKNMGKQPFGKGGIADLGSLADIRAAQVEREERSDPTPISSDEKTKGRFTGGVSGVHRGVANESENTEFDKMLAELIKESNKNRKAKKANQGGYVNNLPTTYAQEGLYFEDDPRSQEIQSLDSEIQKIRSNREQMIDMYKGGGKVSDEEAAKYGASAYNPRLSPLLQERSDLVESAYSPEGSQISETAPKAPPSKNLSGTDVLKAMNAKTRQNRASTDGAVVPAAVETGNVRPKETPTSSDDARTLDALILAEQERMQQGQLGLPANPPAPLEPVPFRAGAQDVFNKFDKENKERLARNIEVGSDKKINASKSNKMVDTFAAEIKKQGTRYDQILSDRQSIYGQIKGAITGKGKTAKEQLEILESSQKAINKFTETGKLPEARRDRMINNMLITMGASLLGNPTMAGALSKGLLAIQKIRSGEEDAYADGLAKNLDAAKKLGDLKIKISDTKQQGIIELAKLKQADSKFDFEAVQRHTSNLLKLKQIEENGKTNSINAAANMMNARATQFKALNDPKIAVPQEYYKSQYNVYRDKYIAALGEDKNQAAADAVTQKWKKWFSIDPKTGVLDPDRPNLKTFQPLIREDARFKKSSLYPSLPMDKFNTQKIKDAAKDKRQRRIDHQNWMQSKNRRNLHQPFWKKNLEAKYGKWTGSSEQKSILSDSYMNFLESGSPAGSSSSAKVKPSQFSGLRRE